MKSTFPCEQSPDCSSKKWEWLQPFGAGSRFILSLLLVFIFSSGLKAQITIDGNPADWPAVLNNAIYTQKAFRQDVNGYNFGDSHKDDGYTQGTSNNLPIESWRWVFGNTNDKGDIENAGAVLIGTNLYFFGDRSAFNGTAELGFWFLLDDVSQTGDGSTPGSPFTGTHRDGDLLILNTFTSGGGAATPKVFVWRINATYPAPGALVDITSTTTATSKTNELTTYPAPGGTSGTIINIPAPGGAPGSSQLWRFTSKKVGNTNTDDGTYYPPLFFEGNVDLATIPGASTCFQSFIMKTTTSANNTAANVDLVAGSFSGIPPRPVVVGDEKCFGFDATATATCTGSTARWYTSTGTFIQEGSSLTLPAGTAAGTYNYNVTCITAQGCESAPRPVSIIINPTPAVDGLVTIEPGVAQLTVGGVPVDDVYQIRLSRTLSASVYVNNPVAGATYTWTRINCNGTPFVDDGKTTFTPNGATGTFTVINTQNIANAYCFKVTITDGKGCVAEDVIEIRPGATAINCEVTGPNIVCAGSTTSTYSFAPVLDPDFNYTWSITGNGTINGAPKVNVNSVMVTAGAGAGSYTVTLTITGIYNALQDPPPCSKTTAVTLITLGLTKVDVSCNGATNGSITATFSGGTAPYTATLNGVAQGTVVSPKIFSGLAASAEPYTVVITDATGCTATDNRTITQPDPLTLVLTPTGATCNGVANGSISAAFGGGGSLEMNIDGGTFAAVTTSPKVFSGLAAGPHTIVVRRTTDITCLLSQTTTVTQPNPLTLVLTPTGATCNGVANGSISAAFGGGGSLEMNIDGGTFAAVTTSPKVFSGLAAGPHTIVVRRTTDITCLLSQTTTVTQPDPLSLVLTPTGATCNGVANGSISAAFGGGGSLEMNIDGGTFAAVTTSPKVFSGLAAGPHTIVVRRTTDITCLLSQTTTVTQPNPLTLVLTPTGATCNGVANGSISAAFGGGGSLEMNIDGGTFAAVTTSPKVFSGLAAGPHTIVVRRTTDITCLLSQTTTVTQPNPLTLVLTPTGATCNGVANGSISAAIGGGGSLEMNIDGGTFAAVTTSPKVFSGLAAGPHTIVVRRTTDITCLLSQTTTVTQPDPLTLVLTPTGATCNGVANGSISAAFGGGGSLEMNIDGGTFAAVTTSPKVFSGLAAGPHTIVVRRTTDITCLLSQTTTVTQPNPLTLVLTPTGATCNGVANGSISAAFGGGGSLEMNIDGGTFAAVTTSPKVFSGLAAGPHTIVVRRTTDITCLLSQTTTVTQPNPLTLVLTPTGATCNGVANGSISAAFGGGGSLEMNIDGGTFAAVTTSPKVFSGLAAGPHTIVVRRTTDITCLLSQTTTVTQPDPLTLVLTPTGATCNGVANGSISAAFGGGGSLEMNIDGGTFAAVTTSPKVFSGLAAGPHTIVVRRTTDITCLLSQTTTVTQPDPLTLVLTPTAATCNGVANGSISAAFGGGGSLEMNIDGGTFAAVTTSPKVFSGLAAGPHTIVVRRTTDITCLLSQTTTVTEPPLLTCSLTAPATLACGSSGTVSGTVVGGTAGYTCTAAFDATAAAGGWVVTNCSVTGTGISVSYTSGLNVLSGVLTVTVTDANGCTTTCTVTIACTGGQACSPGFWRNQTQYWDQLSDVAVNNMPGALAPGGKFITTTNFWTYFGIPVGQCGVSTNASLTMADAMINTNLTGDCKSLVFHGISNLLSAALLPGTYPFPSGSGGNFSGLYTQIRNALVSCNCGPLASTLGAISALHTGTYCQDAANALNPFASENRSPRIAEDDGGIVMNAFPNPYNSVVNFRFASPTTGKAALEVYDILGRKLAIVYQGDVNANTPVNVKYNVPVLNRVTLFYRLTVDGKTVRGTILPDRD